MKVYPIEESWSWLPRSEIQMGMTVEQIRVDNYCREILQILNKVTPQNIDILLDKMVTLNMSNEFNINKLVYYIVRKAENEPLYSEVYAELCCSLNQSIDRETSVVMMATTNQLCGLFKALILKECQLQFDKIFDEEELESQPDIASRLEKAKLHAYRQKMFGIIIFIGQLFKVEFLHEDILMDYISRLSEEEKKISFEFQVECLCKLLWIVGLRIECQQQKKSVMDNIFLKINKIYLENEFCTRVKFALLDLLDLRQNNWIGRELTATPTTIDQIRHSYVGTVINTKRKKNRKKKN